MNSFLELAEAHERRAVQIREGESLTDPSDIDPHRLAAMANHFTIAAGLRSHAAKEERR